MATWSHLINKKRYISTSLRPMTAKPAKVEIYRKKPSSIKSFEALGMWSSDHMTDKRLYFSTSYVYQPWQSSNLVGSNASLLSAKSHNLLLTWSLKVIKQMKNVISLFSRARWLSNLAEGWLMIKSQMSNSKVTYFSDHVVTWGHMKNELHATKLEMMLACEIKISTTV